MARGRKRQVRYWQRKGGGYFVTINGTQHELALGPDDAPGGPTYTKAIQEYGKLLALDMNKGTDDYLVSALANAYRQWLADKHPRRLDLFEQWGRSFVERYGHMKCRELQPYHIHEWLDSRDKWGPTSKWNAGVKVLACINWGAKSGLIQNNQLFRRVQLPEPHYRGKEMRMSPALCDLLIERAHSKAFRLFLHVLRETGCRPVELRMAEVENYKGGKIVYRWNSRGYRHKTAAKTKRDRIIYLTPEADAEVKKLAEARKEGRLFLGPRKAPYEARNMHKQFERIVARPEVQEHMEEHRISPADVTLYSFRHTFASEWIDSGRSIKICADLMGTSVMMLERVYGHPDEAKLHEHYLAFVAAH
jgi:integrase